MIDQAQLVADYAANKNLTTAAVAAKFGITVAQASAVLHLHGVKVRRGNPQGPSSEARQRASKTRSDRALVRTLQALVDQHGWEVVQHKLDWVVETTETNDGSNADT